MIANGTDFTDFIFGNLRYPRNLWLK